MTTYNGAAVADTTIAFQKGITLQQGRALRDNPIAIAEGAAGAPRVQGYAIASDNNGLTVTAVTAADTVTLTVGATPVAGTNNAPNTTYVLAYSWTINAYTGTVRFKCTQNSTSDSSNVELRKNGVVVTNFATPAGGPVDRVVDVSVSLGDVIEWWHRQNDTGGSGSMFSNGLATASDGYVERPVYWLASQA